MCLCFLAEKYWFMDEKSSVKEKYPTPYAYAFRVSLLWHVPLFWKNCVNIFLFRRRQNSYVMAVCEHACLLALSQRILCCSFLFFVSSVCVCEILPRYGNDRVTDTVTASISWLVETPSNRGVTLDGYQLFLISCYFEWVGHFLLLFSSLYLPN